MLWKIIKLYQDCQNRDAQSGCQSEKKRGGSAFLFFCCAIFSSQRLKLTRTSAVPLPIIPVRFEMLFCEFHHPIKPLPECEVPSRQTFLEAKDFIEKDFEQIAFRPVSPECNMSSSQWCCLSLHTVCMHIM